MLDAEVRFGGTQRICAVQIFRLQYFGNRIHFEVVKHTPLRSLASERFCFSTGKETESHERI